MTTKKFMKKCRKQENKNLSVYTSIPLRIRLEKSAELNRRSLSQEVIFLLEGVLPPLSELENKLAEKTGKKI